MRRWPQLGLCSAFRGSSVSIGLLIVTVLLVGALPRAQAATVDSVTVKDEGKYYDIRARLHLQATRDAAFRAATEFERLPDYSPMIESMRRIGHHELASRTHLCVLWYCKTVRQVMRYRLHPPARLDMRVVPGAGDLKTGSMHWRFIAAGADQTRIAFNARIQPDFWVPPLIGPWAIAHALREQVAATANAIERLVARNRKPNDR